MYACHHVFVLEKDSDTSQIVCEKDMCMYLLFGLYCWFTCVIILCKHNKVVYTHRCVCADICVCLLTCDYKCVCVCVCVCVCLLCAPL